ncbi:MAG: hypothetical protein JWN06_3753 [Propionibacteriaceae bacterium]|jgi:phosphoglycerate dehydrogenase-like enzyme|nr:hypothetical protein [Propionibacteriaceae bacterium]
MYVPDQPSTGRRLVVAFAMTSDALRDSLFLPDTMKRISAVADLASDTVLMEFDSPAARDVLSRIDVLITGWGCPRISATVLDAAPRLRLIAHAAGTVKAHVDREAWARGVVVTTAALANARPVAEFTLAALLLAGKNALPAASQFRTGGWQAARAAVPAEAGNYGTTVGIIGASKIGRLLLELLRPFSFRVLLADPTVTAEQAGDLGAELVALPELMARSRIVSLHAPILPSTIGMIGRSELAAMPDGGTFINTARGVLVDSQALREEVASGRINAVLDVTTPEPLPDDDLLLTLPNVTVTPHIAGSVGNELPAMAELAATEVERLAAGVPFGYPVSLAELDSMA